MKAISFLSCLPGAMSKMLADQNDKACALELVSDQNLSASRPLPAPQQVFQSDQDETLRPFATDPVNFQGGLTLFKGRVTGREIFHIPSSDLVPGKYIGGLKVWECAIDLVDTLRREIQDGQLSFRGKKVLELGCGHGLPGIFACLKGASVVHFQDFNSEVLKNVTIPNVNANLDYARSRAPRQNGSVTPSSSSLASQELRFYAGDWSNVHTVLSVVEDNLLEAAAAPEDSDDFLTGIQGSSTASQNDLTNNDSARRRYRRLSGSRACHRSTDSSNWEGGYDIVLMSETVYSVASLPKLYTLIKKCLRPLYGVVYVAGKKHYFGKGGGTRHFKYVVDEDGLLGARLVADFGEGSNIREVWKYFYRKYSS